LTKGYVESRLQALKAQLAGVKTEYENYLAEQNEDMGLEDED